MENRGRGRLRGVAVLAALAAVAVTAAVWTGSSAASSEAGGRTTRSRTTGTSRSTCGRRTTRIPGRSRSSRRSPPRSRRSTRTSRSSSSSTASRSYIKIIKLSLNSANAPDVAEGNQGYQIDSAARQGEADQAARQLRHEVRLEQVLHAGHRAAVPLDAGRQDLRQGQPLGRRAVRPVDRRVLQQGAAQEVRRRSRQHAEDVRGLQQAARQAARQRARRTCRSSRSATRTATRRCTPSAWCRARTSRASPCATGSSTCPGSTCASPGQHQGADRVPAVVQERLLRQGLQRRWTRTTAAAAFAKGTGVFYLGGNWQAQVIQAGLKANAGFMNMPPGPSGKYVAIGATSLPWHISVEDASIPMSARRSSTG